MSLSNVLNIMSSALTAESLRINTIASNLANAESVSGNEKEAFHARHPVFAEVQQSISGIGKHEQPIGGVRVVDVVQSQKPLESRFDPSNPLADENGKVYQTDVNPLEEMADMMAASRHYQASIDVMNTSKNLMMQTIKAIHNL